MGGVICVLSDTHGTDGHRLAGRTLEAVTSAELTVHAGDFTTEAVLDSFETESQCLLAVYGNNASAGVRERLPARRALDHDGVRIAVVHGHEDDGTALSLFGRQENADLVVSGHSHRPGVEVGEELTLLNPGSHAQPRWNRPAHAELEIGSGAIEGRLCEPDGTVFERFVIER